jgi:hypothetical protein
MVEGEQKVLKFLQSNVIATGSRYWASVAPDLIKIENYSDYDFVVSLHNNVVSTAVELALTHGCPVKKYLKYDLDPSTWGVFCFGESTQLIIKYDDWYKAYLKVQSLCTPEYYYNFLWKRNGNSVEVIRDRLIVLMNFFMDDLQPRHDLKPLHIVVGEMPS